MKWLVIFFLGMSWLYAQDGESLLDKLPYGIRVDLVSTPPSSIDREYNLTITQNSQVLVRQSNHSIQPIYRGDLDGDGYEELVFSGFSGGAHCCFDLTIVSLRPHAPAPYHLEMANAEYITFKDLDGDKKPEIITWDDQYSYGLGLCFACSAGVRVVTHYDGHRLRLDPTLTARYARPDPSSLDRSIVRLDARGFLQLDNEKAPNVLREVLHRIYTGDSMRAAALIRDYLAFEHPAVCKLMLMEFVDMMARSPFWDTIRRVNGWREKTMCVDEGCTPPEALYSAEEVVDWLYKEIMRTKPIKEEKQ